MTDDSDVTRRVLANAMGHGNPYTSDDEKQLVKYLATYNPDGKGRKGNTLYKQLTSDVRGRSHTFAHLTFCLQTGRWPWSKRHSWQSWRDHFVRNDTVMNKKIKVYQKKMAVESKGDKKDAKQQSNKHIAGPSSGEQPIARKRERDSFSAQVDPNKRQKVADKQVNMERHDLTYSSSKENAQLETETDRTREDATRRKAAARVSSSNEPELKTFRVLDEQPFERLQAVDHRDDDTEERSEVDKMLENVASSTNLSEYVLFSRLTRRVYS